MNAKFVGKLLVGLSAVTCCSMSSFADPVLTVSDGGLSGGNQLWLVEVAPDPALFVGGQGSLSVELAFQVTGSDLVGATVNDVAWPVENPGNNPFTSGVTVGLDTDPTGNTVFASFGSDPFTTGDAVEALTIETLGSGATTLTWGGQTLLSGTPFAYTSSRIAQAGTNFDGLMGSLTSGDAGPICDFNGDGSCNIVDLNLMLAEGPIAPGVPVTMGVNDQFDLNGDNIINLADQSMWLADAAAEDELGSPYKLGDANLDGSVDVTDFNAWNSNKFTATLNWDEGDFTGDGSADVSDFNSWNGTKFTSSDGITAVPEPTAAALLALAICGGAMVARPRRK